MHKSQIFLRFYLLLHILSTLTSSSPLTLPLTSAEGLNFYDQTTDFGYSVGRAGDINGDGIDDVIIGAPYDAAPGIVYVIYGSKTGLTDLTSSTLATLSADGRGFQIIGVGTGYFGDSVDCAGDVNGDGIEDIIMGGPVSGSNGYAYVMFGKKTGLRDLDLSTDSGDSTIGFIINGPSSSYFGYSVSGTGDVNGDNIDDIIIGAYAFNSYVGAAYVIYGKKTGLTGMTLTASTDLVSSNTGFIITGATGSYLGRSVSGAGDVNGDGVHDIVVGAYYYGSGNGYAAIIFGSKSPLSDLTIIPGTSLSGRGYIISSSVLMYLGWSVSRAGDINGDGLADVIIGGRYASLTSPAITYGGAVFVIYGSATMSGEMVLDSTLTISSSVGFRITCGVASSALGWSVSNAEDFNGDGVDDIILGAYGGSASLTGSVYVIYGNKAGLGNIDGITPTNFVDPSKGFAISPMYRVYSLGWAGDFNGDGKSDILIGAQNNSTTPGATYVLFEPPQSVSSAPSTPSDNTQGLDPSEVAALNAMTQTLATTGKATGAAAASISIINFSNPAAAILKAISDTIYFIKYLNISYPPKLQYILDNYQSQDLISIDSLSSAPQALVDDMNNYPLPAKFQKYDDSDNFYSSFLINFWSSLVTLSGILILVLLTVIFKPCGNSGGGGKMRRFIRWIYKKLSHTVKWNMMLSKFTGYYGSISLFTSIEIRTTRLSSVLEVLSFCICILVTLGLLAVQMRMILVAHQLQKAKILSKQKNKVRLLEVTKEHLKDYEIIFDNFKDDSFFQQSFLFFYNLRIYIFYAVISWLDFPLAQTLLNTSMEVIMFLYLVISRPAKSKIELLQYIVIEVIFLVVNVSTLGLAALDFYEFEDEKTRVRLGDAILDCNNALSYCTLFFLGLSVLMMIVNVVKLIKQKYGKVKKVPKRKHRITTVSHHNDNDNDVSTTQLNRNNKSQFMSVNNNTKSSPIRRARKTPVITRNSTVQYQSNNSLANGFDHQRSELPRQENFIIRQRRALRLQRQNLNGLGMAHINGINIA